jgi:tetratricopeptide (TPR) repeat protein
MRQANQYNRQGNYYVAIKLYKKLIRLAPDWWLPYAQLGKIYKQLNDWKPAFHYNFCTVERNPSHKTSWENLGIAATALRKWRMARTAWNQIGFECRESDQALNLNLGAIAVCINPNQKPEIVWARRLDPARAMIMSVPQPSSGHYFRDIILIDGNPKGSRVIKGRKVAVYHQLGLFKRSVYQTYLVGLHTEALEHVDTLAQLAVNEGVGFDNWSLGYRLKLNPGTKLHRRPEYHDPVREEMPPHFMVALASKTPDPIHQVLETWKVITLCDYDPPFVF